jgi:TonB-linked SusC/RagA family outer membrane protein
MEKKRNFHGQSLWESKLLKVMKLTVLLMLISLMGVFASETYSQTTRLTLNANKMSLEDFLVKIENQSEFRFFYTGKIDVEQEVSGEFKNKKIFEVLDEIKDEAGFQYEVLGRQIILSPNDAEGTIKSIQQQKAVSGKVTDASSQPLPGVTVLLKGTTQGTVTNATGNYTITNIPDNAVLQFSFVGMKGTEVVVGNQTSVNITMEEESIGIEEVVTIGYGTRSKRDVTTAISTVTSDKIAKVVPSSPELLMQGQMSGVQVMGNQGNPNSRPVVRIRGTNTFGIADPLYVIDGIPIKEYGAGIEGAQDQYTRGGINIMAMIDPNDIESISVLKDASSAAIYGVRASNGVVLITTKKGRKEKATVSYTQRIGVQNLRQEIDLLNTKQYVDFNNALYATDPTSDGSRSPLNEVFRPENPNYMGNNATYNWQDAVKNKNAITQDYGVNISGGTDKADYYLSLGYADQEGVYINNSMKRYNGAIKLNVNINKYLRAGINYRLSSAEGEDLGYWLGSLTKTALTPVSQPIYDPNGINGYAQVVKGYDDKGVWNSSVLYGSMTRWNNPGVFSLINTVNSSLRNMGSAYVEIEPLTGLKLKGTLSIDYFDNSSKGGQQYINSYFKYDGGDPKARAGEGSVGDYGVKSTKNFNMVGEFTANYIKSFGDHNIDLLFNSMAQKFEVDFTDVGTDYVTSSNPDLINLGGENQYTRAGGFRLPGALQGFLFRGGYNFANKYYIDATVRRDGSARFAPEYRWGTFPAASAAWRITNEDFMKDMNWLNDLKFRAGWGQLGNQEVTDMAYLSTINTSPTFAWGNNPSPRNDNPNSVGLGYTSSAAAVYGMANEVLQWEKSTTFNLGFDATLLTDISMSFEYYNKLTDGILQKVSLPPSTGVISMPDGNVAQVRNSGFELNLNYRKSIGDFNFSVGGNLTTVKNEVEKLYGGIPMADRGIEEGMPLFYIRGYKVDGIFQSNEEAQAWIAENEDVIYQSAKVTAGDFHFKDLRGAPKNEDIAAGINKYYSPEKDGIVDDYDRVYLGKTIPGFYYGLFINADYKGLDFSAQFTGVGDVQKVNNVKSTFGMPYGEAMNHTPDVLNAWRPDNKNSDIPRMIWQDPAGNGRFSDFFVEDAGYLRLANIQVGYTLPESVYMATSNILNEFRIYIGCSNLFTITNFNDLDPEDPFNPAPLIVYTGLNIKF